MSELTTVFFTDSSVNVGGQELQALQQMLGLNSLGFKTILLCKPNSAIFGKAVEYGIEVRPVRFRNAFHVPSLKHVLALAQNENPAAIFCHGSHDAYVCALVSRWLALFRKRKISVYRIKTFQYGRPFALAYNHLFTKTLTPSNYLRSLFLKNKAINPCQLEVLYPGIDFSALSSDDQSLPNHVLEWLKTHPGPVIAQGAMLRGEKGHSTILEALVVVKKTFPMIRYLIAGEGQDRALLENKVGDLQLREHVYFTGVLPTMSSLLKRSTLAVMPSKFEPLGMFQIEAQYLEIPTIASHVGGISETILDGQTGLLVAPQDISAWVKAISWVLENPHEAKLLGQRAKPYVNAKFSIQNNLQQLIKLIQSP